MKDELKIIQYENDDLEIEQHFKYLQFIFKIKETWKNWQVNEDGSFFLLMDIPLLNKSILTEKKALNIVADFVKDIEKRIMLLDGNPKAAYLSNLFKNLRKDKVTPVVYRKNQRVNHYEVFYNSFLPVTERSVKLTSGKTVSIKARVQDSYIKFSVGSNRVIGLSYICPVFTKTSVKKTGVLNSFKERFTANYFYDKKLQSTDYIISSVSDNIMIFSNEREENQRIKLAEGRHLISSANLLFFPEENLPT